MERIPVLLDTDIGSDIDDALALAYLCRHPQCDLVGVTTVTGDVQKRAAIAEIVCRAYGKPETPIVCGISDTLAHGRGQPLVPHYDAVAHLPHRLDRRTDAVDYLRETIRSRPGEIVLLSIGPFANIAVLFALDPEIPRLLRGFVSMAGSFFRGDHNEWNCACDPASAAAAIRRSSDHLLVGLDVTLRCQMSADEVRQRFAEPPHDLLLLMAETWLAHTPKVTFHDPLATALIFRPELCSYRAGTVEVIPDVDVLERSAHTRLNEEGAPRHRVASEVDAEAFFEDYFAILTDPLRPQVV